MKNNEFQEIVQEAAMAYHTSNEMSLIERSRAGISKRILNNISNLSGITLKELTTLLPVSLRTIQRYEDNDLLEPYVSERALLITEVLARGLDVFHSNEKMRHWLQTPSVALGNRTPLSLLDTSFGARMVTDLLGRIEYGVYS